MKTIEMTLIALAGLLIIGAALAGIGIPTLQGAWVLIVQVETRIWEKSILLFAIHVGMILLFIATLLRARRGG